jgi:hypothetical protein
MIRRMQLLGPEPRPPATRVAALGDRIREGLLHDNKVLPAVLGVLALLIFAWLIAGVLTGDPGGEEEQQQASSKASLAQAPANSSDSGSSEVPSPGADNRDTDSYAAFKAKDPFKLPTGIGPKAAGKATNESTSTSGSSRESTSSGGGGSSRRSGEQSSSRSAGGGGNGSGGRGTGSSNAGGEAGGGGSDQGNNGDLFNSGGDLPLP